MIKRKTITLLIPCKNEEAALYSMLKKVPNCVDEVIVIDNGSTDNTASIARKMGAKVYKEIKNVNGIGYGFAHQTGLKKATGQIIVALDGDDTYPIEKIEAVVEYMLKTGMDFVSCNRFPLTNREAISRTRQLGVNILNIEVALLYGYPIRDILSGMWALKKKVVPLIEAKDGGWNYSPEIKLSAISNPKINFSEFHIEHDIRINGFSKQQIWKTGFEHLYYIFSRRFQFGNEVTKQQVKYLLKPVLSLANFLAVPIILNLLRSK